MKMVSGWWLPFMFGSCTVLYGQDAKLTDPPPSLPDNCSAFQLTEVAMHPGTQSYTMLRYEIAALSVGHDADKHVSAAIQRLRNPRGTETDMLSDFFLDMQIAVNEYRCGAFIAGHFQPDSDDGKIVRDTTISAYNRLAILTSSMQSDAAQKFSSDSPSDNASVVKRAQNLAQMTNDRDEAFSDLINAITLSAMTSLYTGDPTATKADTLNMTAVERLQLISETRKLLKDGNTDKFTGIAGLLDKFLATHEKSRG